MGSSLEPTREGLQNVLRHRRGFSDLVLATWSPRELNDRRTFCTFMLKAAMARYFRRRQQKLVQSNRCKTGPGKAVACAGRRHAGLAHGRHGRHGNAMG